MSQHAWHRRGFTLIEAVVVMIVVLILTAVATATFRSLQAAQRNGPALVTAVASQWMLPYQQAVEQHYLSRSDAVAVASEAAARTGLNSAPAGVGSDGSLLMQFWEGDHGTHMCTLLASDPSTQPFDLRQVTGTPTVPGDYGTCP